MSQNVWKNIEFILENADYLDMSQGDLKQIHGMIKFFKLQVMQQIIRDVVQGNSIETIEKIKEAKEYIERSKIKLERRINRYREQQKEMRTGEYEPKALETDVSVILQNRVEEKRREQYEDQKTLEEKDLEARREKLEGKVKSLANKKAKLEQLEMKVQDPEAFIKTILDEELKLGEKSYKDLISMCAVAMRHRKDRMEFSREEGQKPLFIEENGGYIPDPEAIKSFIGLIRNEKLIKELHDYYMLEASIDQINERIKRKSKRIDDTKDVLDAVNNEKVSEKVEKYISIVHDLTKEYFELSENMHSKHYLPVATNSVIRTFNSIFKSGRVRESEELDKKFNIVNAAIRKAYDEHMGEMREAPEYAKAYGAYLKNAKSRIVPRNVSIGNGNMPSEAGKELYLLYLLKKVELPKEASLKDCVKRPIEEGIEKLERDVEKDKRVLEYSKGKKEGVYEKLTPEAKSYIENGGCSTRDIKIRYNLESIGEDGISPYTASLILEALMDEKGIHTVEDAKRKGIVISEDEIRKAKKRGEEVNRKITGKAEEILRTAERYTGSINEVFEL